MIQTVTMVLMTNVHRFPITLSNPFCRIHFFLSFMKLPHCSSTSKSLDLSPEFHLATLFWSWLTKLLKQGFSTTKIIWKRSFSENFSKVRLNWWKLRWRPAKFKLLQTWFSKLWKVTWKCSKIHLLWIWCFSKRQNNGCQSAFAWLNLSWR